MKTGKTRKVQTNKTNYMSDEAFADLKNAMEDALAFERGKGRDLKVTRIQAPRPPKARSPQDIAQIRQKLNCSRNAPFNQRAQSIRECTSAVRLLYST
ncbi:MAG TPA: hypothetical protein VF290_02840 [Pyrinomonadaceae bacterium]